MLDKELRDALVTDERIDFPIIRHPLVISLYDGESMDEHLNALLKWKNEQVQKAFAERGWRQFIWLHERPYRWDALALLVNALTDRQWFELMGMVWVDSENLWQVQVRWFLRQKHGWARKWLGDADGATAVKALHPQMTVYRGCSKGNAIGWSWTLDHQKAEWFAKRFAFNGEEPTVLHGKIQRERIIAGIWSRGESEVICDPLQVRVERVEKLDHRKENVNAEEGQEVPDRVAEGQRV